jgi:hypothetical protein
MINSTDQIIATDEVNGIDLVVTKDDRTYLYLRHEKPASCFLAYPFLAAMLRTITKKRSATLAVVPLPEIAGIAETLPFIAILSIRNRLVLACAPNLQNGSDAQAIFEAMPSLPMVVSSREVLANRHIYERVMSLGRN